jgi:hypothetical protein
MILRNGLAVVTLSTLLWGCSQNGGGADRRTMSSVEREQPGTQCPAGGQRILTGIDANGDGILEANEVTQVAYVCNGQSAVTCTTLEGSVVIHNSLDWANLVAAGCTRITGTLEIDAQGAHVLGAPSPLVAVGSLVVSNNNDVLTTLDFPALTTVAGDLMFESNPPEVALQRVSFPSLATVGGTLWVTGSLLTELSFPSLTSVGGDFNLLSNAALARLDLPALATVGGRLWIEDSSSLTSLSGMPRLTSLGGLLLWNAAALTDISLPALTTAGALEATYVDSLARFDASALVTVASVNLQAPALTDVSLTALTEVTDFLYLTPPVLQGLALPALRSAGQLSIYPASSLATVDLSALETVGDLDLSMYVGGGVCQSVLTDLSLPNLVTVNGGFQIMCATALEHLSLPALETVSGAFNLSNTVGRGVRELGTYQVVILPGQLQTLSLPSLVSAGSVYVRGESALTTLDVPALSSAGAVYVSQNALLDGVSLPELTILEYPGTPGVGDQLNISDNAVMSSVSVPKLAISYGSIQVANDASLADLTLPALTYVQYDVVVTGNASLASVSMPALTRVDRRATVAGDAALATLDLPVLTSVGTELSIKDNPALPQCQADAIAARLLAPLPATITLTNNDTTTTCP